MTADVHPMPDRFVPIGGTCPKCGKWPCECTITARQFITRKARERRARSYAGIVAALRIQLERGALMGERVDSNVRIAVDALRQASDDLDAGRIE